MRIKRIPISRDNQAFDGASKSIKLNNCYMLWVGGYPRHFTSRAAAHSYCASLDHTVTVE